MRNVFKLACIVLIFFCFAACEQEESLKVNPLEADRQSLLVDRINAGEDFGPEEEDNFINEEFRATVDGSQVDYSLITYVESGPGAVFSGSNNAPPSAISFTVLSLEAGTYDLGAATSSATYTTGPTNVLQSFSGELFIDSLTNSFLIGTFSFKATTIPPGPDTIEVTGGVVKVNRQ